MVHLRSGDYLFPSRVGSARHISTRQYNRIFHGWIEKRGLDDSLYSTHSIRRTKPYLIYKKQKLKGDSATLGHKRDESTVRYPGLEVDDALAMSESIEVLSVRAATAALCQKRTMNAKLVSIGPGQPPYKTFFQSSIPFSVYAG